MFKLPTVKSAFCGCTTEEGSKIIAYIHAIGYGVLLVITIVYSFAHENDPETYEPPPSPSTNLNESEPTKETDMYYMEGMLIQEGFLALTSSYFNDMVFLLQVVFGVFLLIGIYRKNLDFIFSWVLLQITNVIFSQALVTIYFISFFNAVLHNAIFYLFFEEITLGIIEGYFIVVVNSHLRELTDITEDNDDEVLSPIVINSSSLDLRYPEDSNNFVH